MIEEVKQYNVSRPSKMYPRKKVGFFKRWLRNAIKEAWESEKEEAENLVIEKRPIRVRDEPHAVPTIDDTEKSIRFTVHTANGGRVVETYRYDRRKDQNTCGLYVITNDQDFGKEIDKIITMETLKS